MLGTFLRGPNWNFFGPFEFWDMHKLEALVNVNLSEYVWVRGLDTGLPTNWFVREIFGILLVLFYIFALPALLGEAVVQAATMRSWDRRATTSRSFLFLIDDGAADQDAAAVALQPEVHRGDS